MWYDILDCIPDEQFARVFCSMHGVSRVFNTVLCNTESLYARCLFIASGSANPLSDRLSHRESVQLLWIYRSNTLRTSRTIARTRASLHIDRGDGYHN